MLAASQTGRQRARLALLVAEELMISSNDGSLVRIKMWPSYTSCCNISSHCRYLHTALRGKVAQMDLPLWHEQCYSVRGCNFSQTCSHSPAGGGKWRWHPLNHGTQPNNGTVKTESESTNLLQNLLERVFSPLENEDFRLFESRTVCRRYSVISLE